MFDDMRLRAELNELHRAIGTVMVSEHGKSLLDSLQGAGGGTPAARIRQALLADCMRIAYSAVVADGEIGDHEIVGLYGLLSLAANSYAFVVPAVYEELAVVDHPGARVFLERYAADRGVFGRGAATPWPGLTLCRRAAELGDGDALARYQRMTSWLIPAACQVGGVTEADPRWRGRINELDELRRTLARDAVVEAPATDRRLHAFLTHTGIFNAVQQPTSIFENDPFDVEEIHRDARESFAQVVERARTGSRTSGGSRMLLMLGESGCGKTHVLRGFRRHMHEYGRGFVVYAQLQSNATDYARYLLKHLIMDTLARPYSGRLGDRTGLQELVYGVVRLASESLQARVQRLADDELDEHGSLGDYIYDLVDDLIKEVKLADFDPELLRVMMYALHPDASTTSKVYKYLLCQELSPEDRRRLGHVVARTDEDQAHWMIRAIARLACVAQRALVLMVDQADLTGYETTSGTMFKRAIDALYRIVSETPSVIAVIACLSDLYTKVRDELNRPALDRLERDPPEIRLQLQRSYPEIQAIVSRRLAWLFAEHGTVYRPETPVYPIPEDQLREFSNRRTRDILEWCHQFQVQCAAAGKLLKEGEEEIVEPKDTQPDLDQIAAAWNDAMHGEDIDVPDTEAEIVAAVVLAAQASADELGLAFDSSVRKNSVLRVRLTAGAERAEFAIAVTNHSYRGGAFSTQIETLKKRANGMTPVAVRTLEFPRGEVSDKVIGQLIKSGGRRAYLDASTLRVLAAFQQFQPAFSAERVLAWRRRDRPISSLPVIAAMLDLERLQGAPPSEPVVQERSLDDSLELPAVLDSSEPTVAASPPLAPTPPVVPDAQPHLGVAPTRGSRRATPHPTPLHVAGAPRQSPPPIPPLPVRAKDPLGAISPQPPPEIAPIPRPPRTPTATAPAVPPPTAASAPPLPAAPPAPLRIGRTTGFESEPRTLELDALRQHLGIVSSARAANATIALSIVEQALERDVSVIILDRTGELAGYARPDWWQRTADPARARRIADRIDVRLFTPGRRVGRPLALSVIPDLAHSTDQERDRVIQHAVTTLAAMMRLPSGSVGDARLAILGEALAVLARRSGEHALVELIDLIESQDDALVARAARAGRYDEAQLKRLAQDLQGLQLSEPELFEPAAEPLTAATLLARRPDGKLPLAIVSLQLLGDGPRVQSWAAQLINCVSHHAATAPPASPRGLSTLVVLDEAELFMSGGAARNPAKEPLQELLASASAAGIGIILASDAPAALDYRGCDAIATWLVGRITDPRALTKVRPLFERRPVFRQKLERLEPNRIVLVRDGTTLDLEREPALLASEPIAEPDLLALASLTDPASRRGPRAQPPSSAAYQPVM